MPLSQTIEPKTPEPGTHDSKTPEPGPASIEAGYPVAEVGGVLTIDLDALVANWNTLRSAASPADCAAVVKADAYGCGIEPVVKALVAGGCKTFFVAHLAEARRVRAVASSVEIYVLNGIVPGTAPLYAKINARPVIGSLIELAEWDAFTKPNHWQGGAALHFDTGINRLGLSVDDAPALAQLVKGVDHGITLIMSHLACADQPRHPLNTKQLQVFHQVRALFLGIPASLANSFGIFLSNTAHCDLIRPGVALYGSNPTPDAPNPMRPVLDLKGRIILIRSVARGSTVGYGATWTAAKDKRVAIVSVGYGDGYPRAASVSDAVHKSEAYVAGRRCPLAGRVSMDLLAIDVTEVPERDVRRGDFVTLLGEGVGGGIGVDDLAAWSGTIAYELLTNLGGRFARVYRGG
jgi:alanine racemase